MATKDSTRTSRSHDTAVERRTSRKARQFEQHLADRALKRLMAEVNTKAGE